MGRGGQRAGRPSTASVSIPVATKRLGLNVVIESSGMGLPRGILVSLLSGLAARARRLGYIYLSLDDQRLAPGWRTALALVGEAATLLYWGFG
jgi:hypothetical protein